MINLYRQFVHLSMHNDSKFPIGCKIKKCKMMDNKYQVKIIEMKINWITISFVVSVLSHKSPTSQFIVMTNQEIETHTDNKSPRAKKHFVESSHYGKYLYHLH